MTSRWAWILLRKCRTAMLTAATAIDRAARALPVPVHGVDLLNERDRGRLLATARLRDAHRERPAFVIGTGPSLAGLDLSALQGHVTLASNAFWKHPALAEWSPTYYSLVDPVFFDRSDAMQEFFSRLRERARDSTFLVPLLIHEPVPSVRMVEDGWLPAERTLFVAMGGQLADDRPADLDLTAIVPAVLNVAQFNIMVALYAGCRPIYLLGMDHDWLAKPGLDQHFYEGSAGLEQHPTIIKDEREETYLSEMERCARLWRGYAHLKRFADGRGVPIINLTEGSFLDVFPFGDRSVMK